MRTKHLLLVLTTALCLIPLSAIAESRQPSGTPVRNPITIESQIRDLSLDGDIVTDKWVRVRAFDGRRMYARDLQAGDNVHVEGDLDHQVVYVSHITLQMRAEHLGGD